MPRFSEHDELLEFLEYLIAYAYLDDDDDDFEDYCNLYSLIVSSQDIDQPMSIPKCDDVLLKYMLSQPPEIFKSQLRTTKDGFHELVRLLENNEIFHNNSYYQQISPADQIAVTLMRLGSYGSGASLHHAERILGLSKGAVVLCTEHVISSLNSLKSEWVQWPDINRRTEISQVMEVEGFPGCVGFVGGTMIPLLQKPGLQGDRYLDQKHRHSISLMVVCDTDMRITSFNFGWPGSVHDATVYKETAMYKYPHLYFSPGQYLLGNSAYPRSETVIPCYRAPVALQKDNTEFNYCVANARVCNEHAIGILKGRFSSLKEFQKPLNSENDLVKMGNWGTAFVVLHNMLAFIGDSWSDLAPKDCNDENVLGDPGFACNPNDCPCEKLKQFTLQINYERGFLPIST